MFPAGKVMRCSGSGSRRASTPCASLLDQVRERLRYCHYSLSAERSYLHRIADLSDFAFVTRATRVAASSPLLSPLANRRGASPSTHRQGRGARLFLYKRVLEIGRGTTHAAIDA